MTSALTSDAEIDTQIHSHLLINQRVNGGDFLAHQRQEIRVVGEITKQGFITGVTATGS